MATFLSINDGNITDAGVLGSTFLNNIVTNYSSTVYLDTVDRISNIIYGENSTVIGISLNTFNVTNFDDNDILTLTIKKSNGDIITETFPVKSFATNVNGVQNKTWDYLKLSNPFYLSSTDYFTYSIKTNNNANVVSFYGNIFLSDISNTMTPSYAISHARFSTDNPFDVTTYNSSLSFVGANSEYIQYANANNTAFNFGTNVDFTVEAWVKPITGVVTWGTVVCYTNNGGTNAHENGWGLAVSHADGSLIWFRLAGASFPYSINNAFYYNSQNTQIVKSNQWNHIAASRSGGVFRFYVNGTQVTMKRDGYNGGGVFDGNDANFYGNDNQPCYLKLGSSDTTLGFTAWDYTGLIHSVKITNGIGLYTTATINVPTKPFSVDNNNVVYVGNIVNRHNIQIVSDVTTSLLNPATLTANLSANTPLLSAEDPFNDLNKNSLYTDGVARTLGINDPTGKDFTLSANDFTLDFWAKPTVNSGALQTMFSHSYPNNFHGLWIGQGTVVDSIGTYLGNGAWDKSRSDILAKNTALSALSAPLVNNWSQFTINRKHGFVTLYRNGQVFDNFPATTVLTNANSGLYIGGRFTSSQMYNGLLYNVHLVNGTALYPIDFTPPTSALSANSDTLLMMHTQDVSGNRVDDTSQNGSLFYNNRGTLTARNPFNDPTKNSLRFDGVTNRLKILQDSPSTNDFVLSTSDFTLDFWVYPFDNAASTGMFVCNALAANTEGGIYVQNTTTANQIYYGFGNAALNTNTVTATNSLNPYLSSPVLTTWSQFTLTRKRNIVSIYRNGQIIGSVPDGGTSTTPLNLTNPNKWMIVGGRTSSSQYSNSMISNVRLVKGTNLYEIDYTVATSPISATPETTLLLRSGATSAADVSNYANVIYNNRGTLTANNPFNDPNERSLYYDGLSNKLRVLTAGNAFNLSANNFTIELFVYPLSGKNCAYLTTADPTDYQGVFIGQASDTQFQWAVGSGGASWPTNLNRSLSAPSLSGKWNHVTLNRANSTFYATINGAVTDVWNISGAQLTLTNTNSSITIGGRNLNNHFSKSYISNVNFINGTTKYPLTSFDTPTTALTTVYGTVCLVNGTGLLDGSNGNFIDSSSNNYVVSGYGSVSQSNFGPNNAGNGVLNGSTDYLVVKTPDNGLDFGVNDFTVELWVYPSTGYTNTSRHFIDTRTGAASGSWAIGTGLSNPTDGRISWVKNNTIPINVSIPLNPNDWNHLAYVRNSALTVGALFVNGMRVTSAFDTTNYNFSSLSAVIGTRYNAASGFFDGGLSDVRIINGTALYDVTADTYTLPIAPLTAVPNTKLLLNFTNATIFDQARYNGLITYNGATTKNTVVKYNPGSLYFNGSAYLASNSTRNLNLSTSDFTIEGWFYSVSSSPASTKTLFTVGNSHNDGVMLRLDGLYVANSATPVTTTEWISGAGYTGVFPVSTWKHIAVTRKNGYVSTWVNGKRTTTSYIPRNLGLSKKLTIGGASHVTNNNFIGYIDDFRIENGVCLYDTNFEVPSSQIAPDANTKFLLNNSNYEQFTNTYSLCSPFGYGNGESFFMNGSTDALYTVTSANVTGLNNFSMEFWVYPLSMATTGYWLRTDSRDTNGLFLGYTSPTVLSWGFSNGITSGIINKTVTVSNVLSTWNHFVFTKNNNVYTLYRNGSTIDAGYTTSSPNNGLSSVYIGASPLGTTTGYTNGYISNVRVISGTNIFSSNFTPATAEFESVPNTKLLLNESSYDRYTRVDSLCSPFGDGVSDSVLLSGEDGLYTTVNSSSLTGTNFTVEFLAYMLASTSAPFVATNNPTINYGFYIGATNNTTLAWKIGNGTSYFINKTVTVSSMLSTWNHISLVKNGYAYTLYLNGSAIDGDYSVTTPTFNNNRINIGYDNTGTPAYTNAYISNVRVLSGVALYNNNFSPATADFTPVANTKLLLNSDNQNSYLSMSSLSSPYAGGAGSTYFSGTQFISAYHPTNYNFSTNDFTIEFWVYPTKLSLYTAPKYWFVNSFTTEAFGINIGYGSNTAFNLQLGSTSWNIASNLSINTNAGTTLFDKWTHVCLTRSGNIFTLYQNGSSVWSINSSTALGGSNNSVIFGGRFSDKLFSSSYIANARIVNGTCLYTSDFTPKDISSQGLFTDVVLQYDSLYPTSTYKYTNDKMGDIFISGVITNTGIETRTITADNITLRNVIINNNGILTFPLNNSKSLRINGNQGIYINKNGYLNIGSKESPIPSNITHELIFGNTNGLTSRDGFINVYGSYKTPYTTTTIDVPISSNTFTVIDSVSTNWLSGDKIAFVHPSQSSTTYNILTLSSFNNSNSFTTNTNTTVAHSALSSNNLNYLNNIPNFANLTRNVNIKGGSSLFRGYFKIYDNSKVNINNASFQNFGINSTDTKGFTIGTNASGYVVLSGNVFYGDSTSNVILLTNSTLTPLIYNLSSIGNVFYSGYSQIYFNATTLSSVRISNNLMLSSIFDGISLVDLVGSATIDNNYIYKAGRHGMLLQQSNLTGYSVNLYNLYSIGNTSDGLNLLSSYLNDSNNINLIYNTDNGLDGTLITGNYKGINSLYNKNFGISTTFGSISSSILSNINASYNTTDGIYINALNGNTIYTNIANVTAIANKTNGFRLSGNSNNLLTPTVLNLNTVLLSANSGVGMEAYSIIGYIQNISSFDNKIKLSIGNGSTIIDGLCSLYSNNVNNSTDTHNLHILSGLNYNQTYFKNFNIVRSVTGVGYPIVLDSVNFKQFFLENSSLSGNNGDIAFLNTRDRVTGSFIFNNSKFSSTPLPFGLAAYQPSVTRSTGLAFTNYNKISSNNFAYLPEGTRIIDTIIYDTNSSDQISERLIPNISSSSTSKLRSGSKYVAVDNGEFTTVSVLVSKSSNYNGSNPRLILKRNAAFGINEDTVLATLSTGSSSNIFYTLQGSSPIVLSFAVFEFYIDCDGTTGYINVDSWNAY